MEIEFTKKQFYTLLQMVFIADDIINGYMEPDEIREEYQDLVQYLLGKAHDFGLGDLVVYNEEFKMYFTNKQFEEEYLEFVDEYSEYEFWETLSEKLAHRDLARKYSEKQLNKMPPQKRFKEFFILDEEYSDEFIENGLENVVIKKKDSAE